MTPPVTRPATEPWTNSGTSTSRALSGLNPNTTYYWQVRGLSPAGVTSADSGSWWRFTTAPAIGRLRQDHPPANGATGLSLSPTVTWGDSRDAAGYEYCYDTSNNATCNGIWTSAGTNSSVTLSGLNPSTTYYWAGTRQWSRGYRRTLTVIAGGVSRPRRCRGSSARPPRPTPPPACHSVPTLTWSGSSNAHGLRVLL